MTQFVPLVNASVGILVLAVAYVCYYIIVYYDK